MTQKYIARTILHRGEIMNGLFIINITADNEVVIEPFEIETAATIFHDGIIAVVNSDAMTEAIAAKLTSLSDPMEMCNLITQTRMWAQEGDRAKILLI